MRKLFRRTVSAGDLDMTTQSPPKPSEAMIGSDMVASTPARSTYSFLEHLA